MGIRRSATLHRDYSQNFRLFTFYLRLLGYIYS